MENVTYYLYYGLLFCLLILQNHHTHSLEQTSEQPSTRSTASSTCPKGWIHLGQRCFKIAMTPRNYASAKNRCHDLTAQIAIIDDESTKEKESSSQNGATNVLAYLSSDQSKYDFQSKQFYVALSSELMIQHQERLQNGHYIDSSKLDSFAHVESDEELWLPQDDPSLANLTSQTINNHESNQAFVLAYSRRLKRWGLALISPNRKMPFICERQAESISSAQTQSSSSSSNSPESKRLSDNGSLSQTLGSSQSPPAAITNQDLHNERTTNKDSTTTPAPESSSVLFRELPQDQSVVLGSTVELRCSPLDSESSLSWTFNGKNLTQSNRIRLLKTGSMKIEHVRNTDDGNYTCTIHAGGMSESKSIRLEIIERPHQPEYISAELLDKLSTSVRIKWTPGFNGNSPIKKYLAEMRTVETDNIDNDLQNLMQSNTWEVAKANISADQTSVIIPDLKPARKYIFRIRATNRVGTGDPSLPSRPPIEVPVQPPSQAPEHLSGSPKSSTSIVVQWSPPPVDTQNGALKGYKIRHKLAGYASDADWLLNEVTDAAHLTYILEDLIVWQNYEVQVAAENDKGVGPFSQSIFVRTKEGKPDKGPRYVAAEALTPHSIRVSWSPPPPQHINGINQGYKVRVALDFNLGQIIKEKTVPHNTLSPGHSIVIDDLLPYTEYYISVNCFTVAGDGPPNENFVSVKTKQDLPEAIPSLEFLDVLDKSLKIAWKPPRRINGELDHYILEYSETKLPERKISKKFPPGTTEAKITDLNPQTSYTLKMWPYTNVGAGPVKMAQIDTSIPPELPSPPSNLEPTNIEPFSVTIKFEPGFNGHAKIDKWIAEGMSPTGNEHPSIWQQLYISTNHSQGKSVIVRNLRPFTKYKIRLSPVNVVGQSQSPSKPSKEFQTAQIEPEQAPRDLTIEEIKSTSVVARWSPLHSSQWFGNPRFYNITWSESNNSSPVMYSLINDTQVSSFIIKDLEEFTEYSFKIYAVNEVGSSPASELVFATTSEDVPSSGPNNLTAHALSSTAISVDWNTVPKRHRNGIIRGYKIQYQAVRPGALIQHKLIEDNSTKHVTLNDLKSFTPYQLAVAAYTSVGDGVFSAVLHVQTLEDTPGAPQNLSFPTVAQTSARILWDPPEDPNGEIVGYKVTYHPMSEGNKEPVASHELHQNERTFKATNLKPDTHYVFTVTAKTKEGWGQQTSHLIYTHDSELRANLPFFKEGWFTILCASLSVVITILFTALMYIQTKSYKYKQSAIKSTSQDRLGDAGFTIDEDAVNHYNNNGFGLLSQNVNHRRSNGALSQSTANFTLPKSPPRPHPGSVVYSDDGDDDVFEDVIKPTHVKGGASNYDSSDSLAEKPSEISSSTPPESVSADEEYANLANNPFANHYANVNGTLRGHKPWQKRTNKTYGSHKNNLKLPQRPAPSVPQVPGDPSTSGSDVASSQPVAGPSGIQNTVRGFHQTNRVYEDSHNMNFSNAHNNQLPSTSQHGSVNGNDTVDNGMIQEGINSNSHQQDLLNHNVINLNGGRIIVDNGARSRAPLPGFTSFV